MLLNIFFHPHLVRFSVASPWVVIFLTTFLFSPNHLISIAVAADDVAAEEKEETQSASNASEREEGHAESEPTNQPWTPLFNGTDLTGWRNPYDHGEAAVVDNEIHLVAEKKFFLVTEKQYGDFELTGEVKLPEGPANSGFMFRCHVEPNRVFGYQAEVDGSDRRWSGGLYDEGRRGWVWPSKQGRSKVEEHLVYEEKSQAHFAKPEVRDALKRLEWNTYEVRCQGNKLTIRVNGVMTTDIQDDTDAEGYVAIQHHGEKGQLYRFRNLKIREL